MHGRTEGGILSRLRKIAVRMIESGSTIQEASNYVKISSDIITSCSGYHNMLSKKQEIQSNHHESSLRNDDNGDVLKEIRDILLRIESKLSLNNVNSQA